MRAKRATSELRVMAASSNCKHEQAICWVPRAAARTRKRTGCRAPVARRRYALRRLAAEAGKASMAAIKACLRFTMRSWFDGRMGSERAAKGL